MKAYFVMNQLTLILPCQSILFFIYWWSKYNMFSLLEYAEELRIISLKYKKLYRPKPIEMLQLLCHKHQE